MTTGTLSALNLRQFPCFITWPGPVGACDPRSGDVRLSDEKTLELYWDPAGAEWTSEQRAEKRAWYTIPEVSDLESWMDDSTCPVPDYQADVAHGHCDSWLTLLGIVECQP
jgi:hypothetical protein